MSGAMFLARFPLLESGGQRHASGLLVRSVLPPNSTQGIERGRSTGRLGWST